MILLRRLEPKQESSMGQLSRFGVGGMSGETYGARCCRMTHLAFIIFMPNDTEILNKDLKVNKWYNNKNGYFELDHKLSQKFR